MTVDINYVPEKDHLRRGKNPIYAEIEYEMYDEMQGEFNRSDYKQKDVYKLDAIEYDPAGLYYFAKKLEFPYGTVDVKVKVDASKKEDTSLVLQNLPDNEKAPEITIEPEPISLKRLRELHEIEE